MLDLDSPLLALIWQEQFASVAGTALERPDCLLLFLCVWQVYCADRWLDSRRPGNRPATPRHVIHTKRPALWIAALAVGAASGLTLVV